LAGQFRVFRRVTDPSSDTFLSPAASLAKGLAIFQRLVQNAPVKKEQSVQCLILSARGHTLIRSEMLKKFAELRFSHFDWMTFAVKENKLTDLTGRMLPRFSVNNACHPRILFHGSFTGLGGRSLILCLGGSTEAEQF
jgi:hypothetical protein